MGRPKQMSRAVARLGFAGFTAIQVSRQAGQTPAHVSHVLNGSVPWTMTVEAAMLLVTKDRDLVAEVRELASESRVEFLSAQGAS